jgi:hypothetical protein
VGNAIGVLLFVDEGYLSQVEVYANEDPAHWGGIPASGEVKLSEWEETAPGSYRLANP